jgi:hypothetical protein
VPRRPTPSDVRQITDITNSLMRQLVMFQLAENMHQNALGIKAHVTLVRTNAMTLESLLSQFTPQDLAEIIVPLDTSLSPEQSAALAAAMGGQDIPDDLSGL